MTVRQTINRRENLDADGVVVKSGQNMFSKQLEQDYGIGIDRLLPFFKGSFRQCSLGRPLVMTDNVLQKVEHAFSIGCTDKEACIYADIAPSTLYKYCEDHPDFSERKELLKDKPVLAARMAVVKAIESGDTKMAWLYLERKRTEEFGQRKKIEIEDKTQTLTLDEIEAGEQELLNRDVEKV